VALVRAGATFQTANSSNDPTSGKELNKSHDTPIHSLDYSSRLRHTWVHW
jgi:hypothetical protein